MKIKPVVTEHFNTRHTSFVIDFDFDNNMTVLMGDSGTGKTATYSFIREEMAINPMVVCFNYLDAQKNIKEELSKLKNKLIVIDNMDVILDKEARKFISTDSNNQYLLIGRDPRNLLATADNYYELVSEREGDQTKLMIRHAF